MCVCVCVSLEPKRTDLSAMAPCTQMFTPASDPAPSVLRSVSAHLTASPTNPTACPTLVHSPRNTTGWTTWPSHTTTEIPTDTPHPTTGRSEREPGLLVSVNTHLDFEPCFYRWIFKVFSRTSRGQHILHPTSKYRRVLSFIEFDWYRIHLAASPEQQVDVMFCETYKRTTRARLRAFVLFLYRREP